MDFFDLPFSDTRPEHFSQDEVAAFALRTGWVDDIGVINPESTVIERRPLSWWPDWDLLLARDPLWDSTMAAWVLKPDERLVRLNGQSPAIHSLNRKVPPTLTAENALAYIGFFCTMVHGDEGPFGPIRSLDDGILPTDLDHDKIATFIRDPAILKEEPSAEDESKSAFHIETLIYYSDALFLSNFLLAPTGFVEMLEDEPLVGDLEASIALSLRFDIERTTPDDAEQESKN